jgi:SPP1 gp7 family putative phage head morphogenesis protein
MLQDKLLLDFITRHQVYLEQLKQGMSEKLNEHLSAFRDDVRRLFAALDVDSISLLSKRNLARLLRDIQAAQIRHFDSSRQLFLNDLRKFIEADVNMTQQLTIAAGGEDRHDSSKKVIAAIWKKFLLLIIPATGTTTPLLLERLRDNMTFQVEAAVRRAYADKLPNSAALASIIGTLRLYGRDGLLQKFARQSGAAIATILQAGSVAAQVHVFGSLTPKYMWVSILDTHTTVICSSRDGNVYVFGEGPLPPAHVNCRSKIVPVIDDSKPAKHVSVAAWLSSVPAVVADDLRSSYDFARNKPRGVLTLAQFLAKLKKILAT